MHSSLIGELNGDGFPGIVTAWGQDHCTGSPDLGGPLPVDITSWASGCPGSGLCTDVISVEASAFMVGLADLDGYAADDQLDYSDIDGLSVRPSTGSLALTGSVPLPGIPGP